MTAIKYLSGHDDLSSVLALRLEVFVCEQNVPVELEKDQIDTANGTFHVAVLDDEQRVIGTGRIFRDDDGRVHIGRVAVKREFRGGGIGEAVMSELAGLALSEFSSQGLVTIYLFAQRAAIGFYERLGYVIESDDIVLDAGIEHKLMSRVFSVCEFQRQ
ncbi:GNAT family N-acetyltransferase [Arcanobacterium phocae]|uniref:GNAT family N-acetyltransferase n=1 Tax=Arcanobacterium phocae TaxID=131112 RepID=UPI001C0ECDD6|nr:GNAT family N-acetyltransferase [Arcanobacterium phocae]